MKTRTTLALVVGAFCLSSVSFAGPGDGDLLNLLRSEGSRSSLAISDDVMQNINKVIGELDRRVAEMLNKARPDVKVGGFSIGKAPDVFNVVDKLQGEFRMQIVKMLNPAQLASALKLGIKAEGNFAFLMPEVAQEIKLDKKVFKSIDGYRGDYTKLARDLAKQVKNGKIPDVDRVRLLGEKDTELQAMIAKLVTPEQLAQLAAMAKDQ
ncbi:MAG: hypothetical protein WCK51_10105 [Armatimonadota bacterium]